MRPVEADFNFVHTMYMLCSSDLIQEEAISFLQELKVLEIRMAKGLHFCNAVIPERTAAQSASLRKEHYGYVNDGGQLGPFSHTPYSNNGDAA
jgi:hypothetical protein